MLWSALRYSLRLYLNYPARTILSVLSVAIGIASISSLLAVGDSAREQIIGAVRGFGEDSLIVTPFIIEEEGNIPSGNPFAYLEKRDYDALLSEEGKSFQEVIPILWLPGFVEFNGKSYYTNVFGTSSRYPALRKTRLSSGRFFTDKEEKEGLPVAVLGTLLYKKLGSPRDITGKGITMKGIPVKIRGVLELEIGAFGEFLENRIIVPLELAQEKIFKSDILHRIAIIPAKSVDKKKAQELARTLLRRAHRLKENDPDDFSVFTIDTISRYQNQVFNLFSMFLIFIGGVALVVAGVGIMNVMLISVLERTKEIGIRKATGARNREIFIQFLSESLVQALAGALLGIILTFVVTYLATRFLGWPWVIKGSLLILACAFSIFVGIIFGISPALRASSLSPIDAIRRE